MRQLTGEYFSKAITKKGFEGLMIQEAFGFAVLITPLDNGR
ncbi:hypothetical protein [Bathymodiolus japonicus methanotrophic gill symbiont]|nr:hypothetical protein [Bathymodiolus japonicus methanotrophic gill symbiont]